MHMVLLVICPFLFEFDHEFKIKHCLNVDQRRKIPSLVYSCEIDDETSLAANLYALDNTPFYSVLLGLEPGWAGCALASLATELALSSQIKQCLVMLNLNVMALHTSHTINCCIDLLRCRRHYLSHA